MRARVRPIPARRAAPKRETRPVGELWESLFAAGTVEALAGPYLELQCRLIRGVRHGLLVLGPANRGPFEVAAVWPDAEPTPPGLLEGAERAVARRKDVFSGAIEATQDGTTALQTSLIAHPLEIEGRLHGALALELTPRPEAELRERLLQLRWGTGWLSPLLRRSGRRSARSRRDTVELVPNLLATSLEHESFAGAARAFVTDLAAELGCDRVSLGFLRRGRARVGAISHTSHTGRNTNLIRAIEAAMDEAIDQQISIVFPAHPAALPTGTHAHADLVREHGAGAICTVPVVHAGRVCGAITLERPEERPFDERSVQLCEVAASLVAPLLWLLCREDRWLVAKVWEVCRRALESLVGPYHVALKLGAAAAVVLVLLLALLRGDYRVTADTLLEPAVLRAAAAPFDGYIAEAPVRPGDVVREGDLLGSLDDRDLRLEQVKWTSEREQLLKQYRQALAEGDAPQVEILAASLEAARAELERIEDRLSRSELRAPFDGVVINGDLSQKLGAPVEKGDVLFEVAPLDAYRVILKVDETDIAEVQPAQTGRIVFSSLPTESYEFTVEKLTPVATAEEGRNYFRVEARLGPSSERLRPAIEGVAKIEIGRRRLIWIWTHDAIDWLRVWLWKWLP